MISVEEFKKLNLKKKSYSDYTLDYKKFKLLNNISISLGPNNSTIGTAILEKTINNYNTFNNLLTNEKIKYDQITFQLINNYNILENINEELFNVNYSLDKYIIGGSYLECLECGGAMTVSNIQTRRGDESGKIFYNCENNPNHRKVKK